MVKTKNNKMNKMQGTAAFIEYIGPRGRKRRKNCIYNSDGVCKNIEIATYLCKCVGRMYCNKYNDEIKYEEDKYAQSNKAKEKVGREYNNSKKIYNLYKESIEDLINKKYIIKDMEEEEILEITFVKDNEKDFINNKISINSALAKGILNKKIDEIFVVSQECNGKILEYKYKLINKLN